MKVDGWNVLDEDAGVLWREYKFAKGGVATTFVVRGTDGLIVISPGSQLETRDLDALAEVGPVRALVANNTFHHLGQKPWRERFPDAISYAPAGATTILEKKTGIGFRPLSDLKLPAHVRLDDPPGFKSGEVMATVTTKRGAIWFTADLLTNIQNPGAPLKWFLPWFDSGPGFRLFKPGVWLFIKDKRAVREWALARLAEAPPVAVVPGHGPLVEADDLAAQARKQIERL